MIGFHLLMPIMLAGGLLIGASSLYSCVYNRGAEDAEAENLRATIAEAEADRRRATVAMTAAREDLEGERAQVATLQDEIDRINALPAEPPPDGEAREDGKCHWDDALPWQS